MTRTTNARIAGVTYLLYIAVVLPAVIRFDKATSAQGIAAKLAGIAAHASDVRLTIVLSLLSCFAAPVLAVTLYAITRDEDPDLAMLALTCRVGEGILSAIFVIATLGLLWLATAGALDAAAASTLGAFLLKVRDWEWTIGAIFFAVGSTLFSFLLLRGRTVPVPLAGLGVFASVMMLLTLPAELVGLFHGALGWLMSMPMLVFEVTLALWLIIKGVAAPRIRGAT